MRSNTVKIPRDTRMYDEEDLERARVKKAREKQASNEVVLNKFNFVTEGGVISAHDVVQFILKNIELPLKPLKKKKKKY